MKTFQLHFLVLFLLALAAMPAGMAVADNGPHGGYTSSTDACAACHRSHTAAAPRLLTNSVPALCYSCHGATGAGADTNVVDGLYLERDSLTELPAEGVNGRGLKGGGFTHAYMDTDEDAQLAGSPVTSSHDGNVLTIWGNGAINTGVGGNATLTCVSCHDPHGSGNYRSLRTIPTGSGAAADVSVTDETNKEYTVGSAAGNYYDETYGVQSAELTNWCSQCHTRYNASGGSGHVNSGDPVFAYRHSTSSVPCVKCHVAHGTSATMTSVAGTSVQYPDGSSAANDNARSSLLRLDNRRVCYACHVTSDGSVTGFDCTSCHSQPQGIRRQVVDTGGDFTRVSHHINGTATTDDCIACHNIGEHQSGAVNLIHADTGGIILYDGAASTLETFCLACHDNDAAGGFPPFSNGATPPLIDPPLWGTSSHQTGYSCYDCHTNGHGSNKLNILDPWNAAPDGTIPGDPMREEEGFCYTCHDVDGPAVTNIQAEFALPTHHNVSAADPDGEYLECTNCHNPHLANSSNVLASPETNGTTVWSGTKEAFCLTCHDGVPPGGLTFPAVAAGTGYDKSTFVGSTHDTQQGGDDSCQSCHEKHGSSYLSTLKAQYVIADYNTWTQGDGDYAVCWACHDEAQTITGESTFGQYKNGVYNKNYHDKHVNGEQAPCIVCHDVHAPHDSGEQGLISFDFAIQNGYDISYLAGGDGSSSFWINGNQGSCAISCHGKSHNPKSYQRAP